MKKKANDMLLEANATAAAAIFFAVGIGNLYRFDSTLENDDEPSHSFMNSIAAVSTMTAKIAAWSGSGHVSLQEWLHLETCISGLVKPRYIDGILNLDGGMYAFFGGDGVVHIGTINVMNEINERCEKIAAIFDNPENFQ